MILLFLFLISCLLAVIIYQKYAEQAEIQKSKEENESKVKKSAEIEKYQLYINEYFIKKYIIEALNRAKLAQSNIADWTYQNSKFPTKQNLQGLFNPIINKFYSIDVEDQGVIVITYTINFSDSSAIGSIILRPTIKDNQIFWYCTEGSLANEYRPNACKSYH